MGIEPTVRARERRTIGFEDRAPHQSGTRFHVERLQHVKTRTTEGDVRFRIHFLSLSVGLPATLRGATGAELDHGALRRRGEAHAGDLGLEEAWNYGLNMTQNFKVNRREASFSIDLYRTDFVKQILIDVDQSPVEVFFYNVAGKSFSNSLLATLQYSILPGLDFKLVYKWNDVRATFSDGVLRTLPLVARHRGLATVDYTTPDKKWSFNARVQIVGHPYLRKGLFQLEWPPRSHRKPADRAVRFRGRDSSQKRPSFPAMGCQKRP